MGLGELLWTTAALGRSDLWCEQAKPQSPVVLIQQARTHVSIALPTPTQQWQQSEGRLHRQAGSTGQAASVDRWAVRVAAAGRCTLD